MAETCDRVKVSAFIFIDMFEQKLEKPVTGVLFNKYMVLLNRFLRDRGINMGLSHCWYRWGDEVVRFVMPYIDWEHSQTGSTTVRYSGNRPAYNDRDFAVSQIIGFAEDFIVKYSGEKGHEEAIDEVYTEAPFPFQNEYRKLREALKIGKSNASYSNYYEYIGELFDASMEKFPAEFSSIRKEKCEFETVFRCALSKGISRDYLFEMAEYFWFFFCYRLRLNPKCHENVKRSTLEIWNSVLELEDGRFDLNVCNYAHDFCAGSEDPVILDLIERRERNLAELDASLDELCLVPPVVR